MLSDVSAGRYLVAQPPASPEGRDVVFSGQLLGQMIMASDRATEGEKLVRSVHAVFARAGSYASQIELQVDAMQSGRTWASDTVTATQDGRLLSRGIILLNTIDPDLIRHDPVPPSDVPLAEQLEPAPAQAFPGAEVRVVPGNRYSDAGPLRLAWHRYRDAVDSPAANQAILAWATCGDIIGLALGPHSDRARIQDAHTTLSTGVIGHTVHFTDTFDVSEWLLIVTEAPKAAAGRVYGEGRVFTADGSMVAAFQQDSMARSMDTPAPPRRSL